MTWAKETDLFGVAAASAGNASGNGGAMAVGRGKHALNAKSPK